MANLRSPTKRSPSGSSPSRSNDVSRVPRGTPSAWAMRWQLACRLKDRLEMIHGEGNRPQMLRLARTSRNYQELIQRYSNDSML